MNILSINERTHNLIKETADDFKILENLLSKSYKITRLNKDDISHIGEVFCERSYRKLDKIEPPFKFDIFPNYTSRRKCEDFYDLAWEMLQAEFQERGENYDYVKEDDNWLVFTLKGKEVKKNV